MKLLDLVCSSCAHRDEYLLTSEEVTLLSSGTLNLVCAACAASGTLATPEGEISMSPKHGKNFSWQSWSQGQ